MKKILITATAITLTSILSLSFISSAPEPEQLNLQVQQIDVIEKIAEIEPIEEVIVEAQPKIVVEDPIIEDVTEVYVAPKVYEDPDRSPEARITFSLIELDSLNQQAICNFLYRLSEKYPERFTHKNTLQSVEYVLSLFDTKTQLTYREVSPVENTFNW